MQAYRMSDCLDLISLLAGEQTECSMLLDNAATHRESISIVSGKIHLSRRFHFLPPFSMASAKESAAPSAAKPVKVFRMHGISVSIFENHTTTNGRDVLFYKVALQRSYRDGDEWKRSTSFGRDDLPTASLLLQEAWAFILEAEASQMRDDSEA